MNRSIDVCKNGLLLFAAVRVAVEAQELLIGWLPVDVGTRGEKRGKGEAGPSAGRGTGQSNAGKLRGRGTSCDQRQAVVRLSLHVGASVGCQAC